MRVRNPIVVLGPDGKPLAGASVQTNLRPSGTAASVSAAETGGASGSNPATTDEHGKVVQWLERGAYASVISATGLTTYSEPWDAAPGGDAGIDEPWLAVTLQEAAASGLNAITDHAANFTAAPGELAVSTATCTGTLPTAPYENARCSFFNTAGVLTIAPGGAAKIYGDPFAGAASVTLGVNQRVTLQYTGSNWLIVAGEPYNGKSWGVVNNGGEKVAGSSDFTVAKTGTGIYVVEWAIPRASGKYAMLVTPWEGLFTTRAYSAQPAPEASKATVYTYYAEVGADPVHANAGFSFQAIGLG
jgi:hypothetical protein